MIDTEAEYKRIGVYYLSYIESPFTLIEIHLHNKYPGSNAYSFYGYLRDMSISQAFTRLNEEKDITLKIPRSFSVGDVFEVDGIKYMCTNDSWVIVNE